MGLIFEGLDAGRVNLWKGTPVQPPKITLISPACEEGFSIYEPFNAQVLAFTLAWIQTIRCFEEAARVTASPEHGGTHEPEHGPH